jgi:hypothetical protein
MKKFLLLISAFTSMECFSQETSKFELTKDGVIPIVINLDSISANTIYTKSKKWILESYKNPKEVLKADIENESLRINGFKSNAWFYKSLGAKQEYDMEYSFQIEIKESKIRLTFTPGQFWADNQKVLYNYTTFFKGTGEVKGAYKDAKPSLEVTMNDLANSLVEYIKGKKSDW